MSDRQGLRKTQKEQASAEDFIVAAQARILAERPKPENENEND